MQIIRSQDGLSIINAQDMGELYFRAGGSGNSIIQSLKHNDVCSITLYSGSSEACKKVHDYLFRMLSKGDSVDLLGSNDEWILAGE